MNADRDLERRYKRLLALYPAAFRRDHGQEVLAVLMDGANQGQRWPRPSEAVDLFRSAAWMRRRSELRRFWAYEYRHRRVTIPVRVASGIWLVALTAILVSFGHDGWLALLLVPAAALHFYVAYRNFRHRAQR